jgi:hypothetical protein
MYDIFTRLLIDDFTSKVFHAREIQFGCKNCNENQAHKGPCDYQ